MPRLLTCCLLISVGAFSVEDRPAVQGTVIDVTGAPLPGVKVTLVSSGHSAATETNGAGHYQFDCLPDGDYELAFVLPGFLPAKIDLPVRYAASYYYVLDQQLHLDHLYLREHSDDFSGELQLSLLVVDADTGSPTSGAWVEIKSGAQPVRKETDSCGHANFVVGGGLEEAHVLEVSGDGYQAVQINARPARGAIEVRLKRQR